MEEFEPTDWVIISDIDEIPDPKKIKEFNTKYKYACFLQKNFQSKINLMNITDGYWPGSKICEKKNLKSPQWLRDIKIKKKPFWKIFSDKQPQLIENGGWHFSFLKDPQSIRKKLFLMLIKNLIKRNLIILKISKKKFLIKKTYLIEI